VTPILAFAKGHGPERRWMMDGILALKPRAQAYKTSTWHRGACVHMMSLSSPTRFHLVGPPTKGKPLKTVQWIKAVYYQLSVAAKTSRGRYLTIWRLKKAGKGR